MKGFTKDKKFRPMNNSKGVRKSRDQKEKTQGVRMKKTNVSSIKAGGKCFCGRTSIKGGLCPSCRDSGVFFEKQQIAQAQRNPKNIGAMERNARENFADLLRNNLESFNRNHSPQLEYGDDGGTSKGLKYKGTNSFILGKMTREQALDTVIILDKYLNRIGK